MKAAQPTLASLILFLTASTTALPQFHQYQSANDDFNIDNFDLSAVASNGIVTTITQPKNGPIRPNTYSTNSYASSYSSSGITNTISNGGIFHLRDVAHSDETTSRPCGFKIAPCPSGTYCSAKDPACPALRGENCAGTCKPKKTSPKPPPRQPPPPPPPPPTKGYKSCGGFRQPGTGLCDTAAGEVCIDDPRALANGSCGMACDAPGICVKPEFCGGFAGFKCKDPNKVCMDDPRDDCDPKNGGADCSGICI